MPYLLARMNTSPPRFSPRRLQEACEGTSIYTIAAAADVTDDTIRNWQRGKGEPPASKLSAIATLLDRPLDFFYEPAAVPVRTATTTRKRNAG